MNTALPRKQNPTTLLIVLVVAVIALIFYNLFVMLNQPNQLKQSNEQPIYQVRILSGDTGEGIPFATVILEVDKGEAPLDEVTDSTGLARFDVPVSSFGKRGRLIVNAKGYDIYRQEIDLTEGPLPDTVPLKSTDEGTAQQSPLLSPTATKIIDDQEPITNEIVQNIGSLSAAISITAYGSQGKIYKADADNIKPGEAIWFSPEDFPGMPKGFTGSGVMSSDESTVALSLLTTRGDSGEFKVIFPATTSPATALYFPIVKNNRYGKTTSFHIQNAGLLPAQAIAEFKMDNGSVYPFTTTTIGPNKSIFITPDNAGVPGYPSDDTRVNIGSLTITSSQPLTGMWVEHRSDQPLATLDSLRALSPDESTVEAYAPFIRRNLYSGRFTNIRIMNVSKDSISATITYNGISNGDKCKGQVYTDIVTDILPRASKTLALQDGITNLVDNCAAQATIRGTGNFIALVIDSGIAGSTSEDITYVARSTNTGTNKLAAPIFSDHYQGYSSSFQIYNVGNIKANNVVANFYCLGNGESKTPFTAISRPQIIEPGNSYIFYRPGSIAEVFTKSNAFILSNSVCSVIVTGDQPLFGFIAEMPDIPDIMSETFYQAFNIE